MHRPETLKMTVFASLMAAMIVAGAYVAIPIGPVPIVLQNLFVLLTGLLLGPRWGLASVCTYLLAGVLGLPVFAGGAGGIARLAGPTGGYLVGYLPAVVLTGWISGWGRGRMAVDVLAMGIASGVVYALGVSWLKLLTAMTWTQAAAAGMLPFLPGDVAKIAAAAFIARSLRPVLPAWTPAAPAQERP